MKISKIVLFLSVAVSSMSFAYFWEDWGTQMTPEERMKKEEIDLKYQSKVADIRHKQQQVRAENYEKSREKQSELEHKKAKLELDRKKARLKVEQE